MIPLSPSLSLYSFIAIASYVNGYFLFAANIKDFENLAKEMIPAEMAERLSEIAANPKVLRQHTNAKDDKNEDSTSSDQSSDYEHVKTVSKDRNDKVSVSKNKRNIKKADVPDSQNINVDQLTQEIKEKVIKEVLSKLLHLKLVKELSAQKRKLKRGNKRQNHLRENNNIATIKHTSPNFQQITTRKQKSTNITINYGREYVTPSQLKTDTDLIVEEIPIIEKTDLSPKVNDSYEYYVAPEKEDNVFTSVENNAAVIHENTAKNKIKENGDKPTTEKYDTHQKQGENYYLEKSGESGKNKTITGNLQFDDKEEVQDTEILTDSTETKVQEPHQTELHTVKSIRQRFSWTSPNYYASLPTIAEKYNFNEPLPDKDRNRETIRRMWTTASSIQ